MPASPTARHRPFARACSPVVPHARRRCCVVAANARFCCTIPAAARRVQFAPAACVVRRQPGLLARLWRAHNRPERPWGRPTGDCPLPLNGSHLSPGRSSYIEATRLHRASLRSHLARESFRGERATCWTRGADVLRLRRLGVFGSWAGPSPGRVRAWKRAGTHTHSGLPGSA